MRTASACSVLLVVLASSSDPSPVRIAVVGSHAAALGAVLAAEDINAEGGINGRLFEAAVVVEPEHATARQAIALAESLSNDDAILAVVGHGGSATSLATAQVYNARGVPQIAPNTSSPRYQNAGPFSFRLVASDDHQAEFIAGSIAAAGGAPRVAVLYANDDYGRALNEMLRTALRKHDVMTVHEAPFISGDNFEHDAGQIVRGLAAARPDMVIWIGLSPELKLLRPRLRAAMPNVRVFASDGASFIGERSDIDLFRRDWLVAYSNVSADSPRMRSLATRFLPLAGRPITDGAVLTYDAVRLAAQALREGGRSRRAVQKFLDDGGRTGREYDAVSGSIRLDTNGDARPSYVLLEMSDSGPRAVKK